MMNYYTIIWLNLVCLIQTFLTKLNRKNKGCFLRRYLVFGFSNVKFIYVVGVNSGIAKGAVKVFGTYVIRHDLQ